jgi:phage-related protein (TIGR01555 family)
VAGITKKTMERAARDERRQLKAQARDAGGRFKRGRTKDSFQNFALQLGMGTDNVLATSTYGFNPITRNRILLEWMHRGSWLAGMAVDIPADDMVRSGIDIQCDAAPEEIDGVQQDLVSLGVWDGVRDTSAWSRLYGGAIGVILIDGQDYSTPLNPDKIGRGQFRGVMALDRWMVEPSLQDLVPDQGPQLGLPKFYRVTSDIPGMRNKSIHHSRVIRFDGIRLPYWQRVSENLWGISMLERLYDRMVAFDSTTQGAAQLAYKSYLRTIKIKGLREILAAGGPAEGVLINYVEMMRRFQGIEGLTMLDSDDEFEAQGASNFAGMSDVMLQMGQQISGALQIPLVRLFGQSPAGLNSTGESDLRTYYDGIAQQQTKNLLVPMRVIVRAASLSGGWKIGDDYSVVFRPLWQLSEEQKSEVAARDAETVVKVEESGIITQQTAMKELKQQSKVTGRFTNITDEEIEAASDELPPRGQEAIDQETEAMSDRSESVGSEESDEGKNDPKNRTARDASWSFGGKWSKTAVHYGPGRWPTVCGNCEAFRPENGCRKVLGTISFAGWCDEFHKIEYARNVDRTRDSLPISELHGIPIAIESARGTIRRGRSAEGQDWESVQPADYGYIRRAPSAEGPTEWLDCMIGEDRASTEFHVIDGYDPVGAFDEHKVMAAFSSRQRALECYHAAYGDGRRAGGITTMSADELRSWYETGDVTRPLQPRNLRLAANAGALT